MSAHILHHSHGEIIAKRILTSQWMRKIDSQLSSAHNDSVLAALKLLNSISTFAGGKEQKALLESFSWDVKVNKSSIMCYSVEIITDSTM